LEISFIDVELRQICEDPEIAYSKLGHAVAENLKSRIADLDAALTIEDVIAGNPRIIKSSSCSYYIIDLSENLVLIVHSAHVKNIPLSDDNELDWSRVTRVQIKEIRSL